MPDPTQPDENILGIETEQINGVQVLRFRNAKILNERSISAMGSGLMACLDSEPQPPRLVVRFDGVNFLSSAAIGKLVMVQRKVKERGGELMLCDLKPSTLEVFRVARLHDYFRIFPDLESALAELS